MKRLPALTLALVGAALLASSLPAVRAALVLERAAVLRGEWWRLASGHLVHSWPGLAAVDLSALLVLGACLEQRDRAGWIVTVLASGAASSAAVWFLTDLESYQGASALVTGVFAMLAVSLALGERGVIVRLAALGALLLLVWKTWIELVTFGLAPVFVRLPLGVLAVAEAHAAGGAAGALVGLASFARTSRLRRAPTPGETVARHGARESAK